MDERRVARLTEIIEGIFNPVEHPRKRAGQFTVKLGKVGDVLPDSMTVTPGALPKPDPIKPLKTKPPEKGKNYSTTMHPDAVAAEQAAGESIINNVTSMRADGTTYHHDPRVSSMDDWMVSQHVKRIKSGAVKAEDAIADLHANGYHKVANELAARTKKG